MSVHSRPGNLTDVQRKERLKRNAKRSYGANQPKRVVKSKANRDEVWKITDLGIQLGDTVAPVLAPAKHWVNLNSWQAGMPTFEVLIPPDAQPSIDTFFSFVVYLLPVASWPDGSTKSRWITEVAIRTPPLTLTSFPYRRLVVDVGWLVLADSFSHLLRKTQIDRKCGR
jgi:hypothetical protein